MAELSPFSRQMALLMGQWFSCGLSPKAPGTVGSLGALPLFFILKGQSGVVYWSVTLFVSLAGFWSSQKCSEILEEKDPQSVVIDEVAGVLIALGIVRHGPLLILVAGWVLFRFFDITKPSVIDRAQYWQPNGVGIMADDLIAGSVAGVLALGAWHLIPF